MEATELFRKLISEYCDERPQLSETGHEIWNIALTQSAVFAYGETLEQAQARVTSYIEIELASRG